MPPFHQASIAAGSDCAVLRVTGEVDMSTAPQLREQVIQLASNGVLHIIADLRGVDFLDSAGLAALVGSLKRIRTRGGSLTLAVSPGRTLRLLQITGLTRAFALTRQSWTPSPPTSTGRQPSQAAATAPRDGAANMASCDTTLTRQPPT
jgi:anti-sigma B factor antagonist